MLHVANIKVSLYILHLPTRAHTSMEARCEILDVATDTGVQCHRCRVLNVSCSYSEMNPALFEIARTPQSTPAQPTKSFTPTISTSPATVNSLTNPPNLPSISATKDYNNGAGQDAHLWFFVPNYERLDWAAPLPSMQRLCSDNPPPPTPPITHRDQSLGDILTHEQTLHLLKMCQSMYSLKI